MAADLWNEPVDDAKTLEIKRPDPLASTVVMSSNTTMTIDRKELQDAGLALPFQSAPATAIPISVAVPVPPRAGEFTGTVSLSVAEVLRAEARAATPFESSPSLAPVPLDVSRALHTPRNAPTSTPTAPARTIGEAAVAGILSVPAVSTASFVAAQIVGADPAPVAPEAPQDAVVLLYLHRPAMQRIVRKPAWQPILDALEDEPIDPESDDAALSTDPAEIHDQTQAYAILKQGRRIDRVMAAAALDTAANKAGRFAPPIEIIEGELEPSLDEIELLRTWLAIVPSLGSRDERLQLALDAATTFLATPGAAYAPPLVRRHLAEVRQVYSTGKHATPMDEIDQLVNRALLEQRHYQKRSVLGGEHLRAVLHCFGQSQPFVVYVPLDAAANLPLAPTFCARLLAEVHYAQDDQETDSIALRSLALASVVRRMIR